MDARRGWPLLATRIGSGRADRGGRGARKERPKPLIGTDGTFAVTIKLKPVGKAANAVLLPKRQTLSKLDSDVRSLINYLYFEGASTWPQMQFLWSPDTQVDAASWITHGSGPGQV